MSVAVLSAPDEVSVLGDAWWLGTQNTDLAPEGPDLAVARRLESAGLLEPSVTGRILGKPCYRVGRGHDGLAEQCRRVIEGERAELRLRILTAVGSALASLD